MSYAHVEHGALVRFLPELPFVFKGVARVPSLTVMERAALGLLPVIDLTPEFDPLTTRLANRAPSLSVLADRVELIRSTEPIPRAEIDLRDARKAFRDDPRAVELRDNVRTATPADISAWVDAQVTDLASARTMFKRLLIALALLSR